MWKRLQALPPYLGGKRKLMGRIFKHLPGPTEAPVFIDAFLGGGSVSLMAKARGYRVICYGRDNAPGGEGEDADIDNISILERK